MVTPWSARRGVPIRSKLLHPEPPAPERHIHFTPMDTTIADTLIGTTIDGRYRITGRVARGGMATVYTATDERLERTVALKIIHPTQAPDTRAGMAGFVARFTDE